SCDSCDTRPCYGPVLRAMNAATCWGQDRAFPLASEFAAGTSRTTSSTSPSGGTSPTAPPRRHWIVSAHGGSAPHPERPDPPCLVAIPSSCQAMVTRPTRHAAMHLSGKQCRHPVEARAATSRPSAVLVWWEGNSWLHVCRGKGI